jgi:RHS repeat-associated protein
VQCWGDDGYGQLGDGTTTNNTHIPVDITKLGELAPASVVSVGVGADHACALIDDGTVKCWGDNEFGQLGQGSLSPQFSSIPRAVPSLAGVAALKVKYNHTCALLVDGTITCWGDDWASQSLGPTPVSGGPGAPYSSLAIGALDACAVQQGQAYCWGDDSNGQLGDGTADHSTETPKVIPGINTGAVSDLAIGVFHACALAGGERWCWGVNTHGQFGNGTTSTTPADPTDIATASGPLSAGDGFTCEAAPGAGLNVLKCAGVNSAGELGRGGTIDQHSFVPVLVNGDPAPARSFEVGELTTCGVGVAGGVYCWGDNSYGEVGEGDENTPVKSPTVVVNLPCVSGDTGTPCTEGTCDDGDACTDDTCDPTVGVLHAPHEGASCSNDICNPASCDANGTCVPGQPASSLCCDSGTQQYAPPGSSCSDNNACNGLEECNGNGTCEPGTPVNTTDTNTCHVQPGSCDPATGDVTYTNVDDGTSCTADLCTSGQRCTSGVCHGGTADTPTDGNPCHVQPGSCDPATGDVTYTNVADGTPCTTDLCKTEQTCSSGVCANGTPVNIDDGNDCTQDDCNSQKGVSHTPEKAGQPCDPATGQTVEGTGYVWSDNCSCIPAGLGDPPTADLPAVDLGTPMPAAAAATFLYTDCSGTCPQTGVNTDPNNGPYLDVGRLGVISGTVTAANPDGQTATPLPFVTVTVSGHTEFGQTMTRDDGAFDLAVNGGGTYLVQFELDGYITGQRWVKVPWDDYAPPIELSLVAKQPSQSVTLDGTGPQLVAGQQTVDPTFGNRQAVVRFPAGTEMTYTDSNNEQQPVSGPVSLSITEITKGDAITGAMAMPGTLPPTSGYTYAVDVSVVDQNGVPYNSVNLVDSNGHAVQVPIYVDNFLDLAVGQKIPTGYYDKTKGAWIPSDESDDGCVIQITSIDSDTHQATVSDSGLAGDCGLNLTADELTSIGTQYSGETLPYTIWRVPVTHFTPWDFNFSTGSVSDCQHGGPCDNPTVANNQPLDNPNCAQGSIIECQNQVLGERVPIVGTGMTLNYRSSRAFGYASTLHIKLFDPDKYLPSYCNAQGQCDNGSAVDLEYIEWTVDVAGHHYVHDLEPADFPQSGSVDFNDWDGTDAFNRKVNGVQNARITITYVYPTDYTNAAVFGQMSGATVEQAHQRAVSAIKYTFDRSLGAWGAAEEDGLGGWTLSAEDTYDPLHNIVYYGSGSQRAVDAIARIGQYDPLSGAQVGAFAGKYDDGSLDYSPFTDPQAATAVVIGPYPYGVAAGPDDAVYVSDWQGNHVFKVVDGEIYHFAGSDSPNGLGDGGPATAAGLSDPEGLAVGPDGSVYIADTNDNRIRRVDPKNGYIYTVAGGGSGGDGDLAINAALDHPSSVAVAADGTIYIGEGGGELSGSDARVRRVDPGGTITTYAGIGTDNSSDCSDAGTPGQGGNGDNGKATAAEIGGANDVALGPDGSLYIATTIGGTGVIRQVLPDGTIQRFAGKYCEASGTVGGGDIPRNTRLGIVNGLDVGPDGTVYAADTSHGWVLAMRAGEPVYRIVGKAPLSAPDRGDDGTADDGELATSGGVSAPYGVALLPDGRLVFAEFGSNGGRVRVVGPSLGADLTVPSGDGSTLDVFNGAGLETSVDSALTGKQLLTFGYTTDPDLPQSQLTSITDAFSNTTAINVISRGDNGETDIVAPGGQTTVLTMDGNGYLSTIKDPANNVIRMTWYGSQGLLESFTDARNNTENFTYDADGRLTSDIDFANGTQTLSKSDVSSTDYTVAQTNQAGVSHTFDVNSNPYTDSNGVMHANTDTRSLESADGTVWTSVGRSDGVTDVSRADGTTVESAMTPDPYYGMALPQVTTTTTLPQVGSVAAVQHEVAYTRTQTPATGTPTSQTRTYLLNGADSYTDTYNYDQGAGTRTDIWASPLGNETKTTLDQYGRATEIDSLLNPTLKPIQYDYTVGGVATDKLQTITQGSREWVYGYYDSTNDGGNQNEDRLLYTITNPLSQVTHFTYDNDGRVTTIALPGGTTTIAMHYDGNGNLTSFTPPGRPEHDFTYTPENLLEHDTPPAVDDGTQGNSGTGYSGYTWDKARRLSEVTREDSSTVKLDYSDLYNSEQGDVLTGKLSGVTLRDGSGNVTGSLGYDYFNGSTGLLQTASGPGTGDLLETLGFNYQGPLLRQETWSNAVSGQVAWVYNGNFWVDTEAVTDAHSGSPGGIKYCYDSDGRVTQIGSSSQIGSTCPGTSQELAVAYDDSTGAVTETFGGANDAGLTVLSQYNAYGELESYTATDSKQTGALIYEDYNNGGTDPRDALGRITTEHVTFAINPTGSNYMADDTVTYGYDANRNWLTSVDETGTENQSWLYYYDANGNRKDTANGADQADDQDRLLTLDGNTYTYTYTPNGELKTKTDGGSTTTYHYDALGNLTEVDGLPNGNVTYVVDALGRRVQKTYSGTTEQWLYRDGLRPIAQLDGSGHVTERFVYADGTPASAGARSTLYTRLGVPRAVAGAAGSSTPAYILVKDGSAWDTYAVLTDQLGSPRLIVNITTGIVAEKLSYDAWGNVTRTDYDSSGNVTTLPEPMQPFGFAGGLYDADTGLVRFGARDYDPETGRWTAPDPLRYGGGLANIYEYAGDDPIDGRDARGTGGEDAAMIFCLEFPEICVPAAAVAACVLLPLTLSSDRDCSAVHSECVASCTQSDLETDKDLGGNWGFYRCIDECMHANGC